MSDAAKALVALAQLAEVHKALTFLAYVGVIKPESINKGCRKFTADHPEINAAINQEFNNVGPR